MVSWHLYNIDNDGLTTTFAYNVAIMKLLRTLNKGGFAGTKK